MLYDEHLDMFLQAAEAGSFSKAADAAYITPSAVIKQIGLLESRLGVKLFERSYRGIKLTGAGETLYREAKPLILYCREVAVKVQTSMRAENSVIRIGISPLTPPDVLLELWPKLHAVYPELRFQLAPFENTPSNARQILKNLGQNIDVVAGLFDESLLDYRECCAVQISREKFCAAVSVRHRFAEKDRLTAVDLYGETLMLIEPGKMCCVDRVRNYLIDNHPRITIKDFPFHSLSVFNECEHSNCVLLAVEKWKNVHPLLKIIPVDWEFDMPYGLLHASAPDAKVISFLNAVKLIISG